MPRAHDPDASEPLVEPIIVGAAIEELGRSTDDEARALRRALLVLALISDHDGQREAVRAFRTFLLSRFAPLTRGFADGKHELVVNVGTVGRRFLPTQVHVSVHSHVTGAVATCNRVFVPAVSLAVEPVRIDARTILLDDWHRSLARDGYTIEWVVSVADRCGRLLTHWDNVVRYQAA